LAVVATLAIIWRTATWFSVSRFSPAHPLPVYLEAALIIATIPARTAMGSRSQAPMIAARSGSI
jgi:hypothetical protein